MKKFAKILGFLGFFVTLCTIQIGTAWAERVECQPGYYLPMRETTCVQCPSAANNGGVGVFCSGGVHMEAPYQVDMGIEPCGAKQCSSDYSWNLTPAGASSPNECKGECQTGCIRPNSNCPLPNINLCGYNRNIEVNGQIQCGGSCTPENTPENYCPVTCPKSCEGSCVCPGDNCNGYVETNIPGVQTTCPSGACDVTHQLVGNQYISVPETSYQCLPADGCKVECSHDGNPNCPNGTTCEWNPNSPSPVLGYLDAQNKCRDYSTGNIIENFACDIVITGCADQCQYWDESKKMCVTYQSDTYYKCGNQSAVQGPDAVCGDPYTINRTTDQGTAKIIDTSTCAPAGYRFQGWKLTIDYSPYNGNVYTDPDVPDYNRFERWQATTNDAATFVAEWEEDKLYIHYHRYGGNWVQSNPPANDKEAFTISDLQPNGLTKYWTLTRDNSTFRGWCDDLYYSHLSDTTWLNVHCHSPYTIPTGTTSDVYLYAWWECANGYSLGSDYQCAANGIDVIYTCTSPDGNHTTINRSFSNDATVGVAYTIRSIGTDESNHQVNCSFPGYYLENGYRWKRIGSNPEELYEPGPMDSPWAYTSTQTFELSGDYWKPNTYRVLYKCGSIDGTPVTGNDTADSATYGQPYYIAGGNVISQFMDTCNEPNGYVVDYWTFEDQTNLRYGTGEQFNNPNGWNIPEDDHYFVAHWVQTGGTLTLDPNGGSASNPTTLYTTQGTGVYLDSTRVQLMSTNSNGLTTNPTKSASVQIYPNGEGANFQWNESTITYPAYVDDDITLDFTGFYNDDDGEDNIKLCIGTNKFITSDGINIGKNYNISEPHTWYAHWDSKQVYLPVPTRAGYDFLGWYDDPANGNWVSNGNEYYEVSGDVELYAHWGIACRSVSFNENGGTSTGGGNNDKFWKISGQTGWYSDSACTSGITPNVGNSRPTKENATFIGYDDTGSAPNVRIFNNLGAITVNGLSWTISNNVTLYAQYECDDLYHFNPQTGNCEMCDAGQFYDPETNSCNTCADILGSNWTSKEGYTWSIDQCYRNCGTDTNDDVAECAAITTPYGHGFEQFITTNGGTGRQISFYGNEQQNIYTCRSATGATKCPLGLLNSNNPSTGAQKPMAAAVRFNNTAQGENESRYIIGNRAGGDSLSLADGFAWSQVVGAGQQGPEITTELGTYRYTFITYPADTAPAAISREHQTFAGYGYPETNATELVSARNLTADNANGIIQFAKNLNPAQNNMSPDTRSQYSRNLWPIYTDDPTYTLTYSCGDGGGTPPAQQTNIYAGNTVSISVPSDCSHYSTHSLTGWAVTATEGGQNFGTVPAGTTSFTWNYDQNVTFTAVWGNANQYSIEYENMTNATRPADHTTTMPDSYTYGVGATISGVPTRDNSIFSGWCTDSMLSNCQMEQTIGTNDSGNKTFWAKWECQFPYHLNADGTTCEPCDDNEFWDGDSCESCPDGWFSNPPYNWSINQCYKLCDGSDNYFVSKSCTYANDLDFGSYSTSDFLVQQSGTPKQIVLYGNYVDTNVPNVCLDDSVKYCPRVVYTGGTGGTLKLRESLVRFMKHNGGSNDYAGTRYIVGNRSSTDYDMFTDATKIWSHIVGDGQRGRSGEHVYTVIIYPTDTAPSPDSTPNPAFKGYFDGTGSNATQRVTEALGLDSTNAVAFPQSPLSQNQIGDRILYPQYCANGETWNGQSCTGNIYTVKYICGAHGADVEGMSMENTATYGQPYKVAYQTPSNNQQIAACNPNTGYVLKTNDNNKPVWKFNDDDTEYFTGEVINQWNFTIQSPTFTAQYDCAAGYTANGDVNDGGSCVLGVFTVTYDCGIGTGGRVPDSGHPVSTNGTYNVLPNGTANGGVVNCNLDGQGFAGWKFSENTGVNTYNAGNTITWQAGYDNETLTAQYRTCNSNEILVNGVCYPKCNDTTCTEPAPQNSQSHCPANHNPAYPNNVTCSYAWEDISGYLDGGVCRYANGINQGQPINIGVCQEMVACNDSAYVWNSDPTVWACVPNTGITYNVQFKCNETDAAPISGYSFNVTYGQSITIPSDSDCQRTGYSYSQWKATQYSNPATLEAQNSTRTINWNYTHNETFIADWNDGNVYHVNLHAYSCDDSTQTGTFGNSGVQELWEKYGVKWYRTNVGGTLSNPITELTTQQLPTRSGWTFGGYNTLGGDQRVRYANGAWNVSPTTLITEDEEWCAIWSQCNPNEYWNNGVCVTCNTATNGDFPLGDANATSINQCYRQCSICTQVCPQTEGVDYCEFGNNSNMNGNLYYPGTGTCQPNYEQNCPITVLHCLPGYTPNGNNTACVPNNYMITLNSHIDGFNGYASSPEVLYTKYGPNGGAYLDSAYAYPMNDDQSLYAVPVKSADVILNGNGGNVIWNGYSSSTATLTATFDFQGFYPSVYGGSQYIFDTGYISTNGNIAAQQNQSNSTVWHAQWQDGSITLPDAQRQCYTFGGWWTDMYNGVSAGNANMPYTPTGATTNLYAHWTPGNYSITYHNGNAIYSGCSTASYTFGNAFAINCSITPQAGSHKVFNGWCTNPELTAGCTQNPVISNTDCGDKDYYAWWGCESGYNLENGVCVPNASELCPATTLQNNSHAILVNGVPNDGGTQCIYTLKCDACIGCNSSLYTCYTNGNSANNNGIFTVTGNIGDANVLADTHCNPTEYDVYYRCDGNSQGYAAPTKAVYGQAYSVEYNPHNNANGGQLDCQSNNQLFNGWTFNGEPNQQFPYSGGTQISPWVYCNITPIFTAQYGQCPTDQVYVPSLGECKYTCTVNCTWPGYPANPAACPTMGYPFGAMCYYNSNSNQLFGYKPSQYSNQCLDIDTGLEITTPRTCNVDSSYDPICPDHYTWNASTRTCDPDIYYVTLNSNNGTEDPNFVSKLFEQYNVGWSTTENDFVHELILGADELPSSSNECEQFDGYYNRASGGQRMVQPSGFVGQNAVQPLPATTITNNNQTWYAHYVTTSASFTIRFRCSANGGDIYSYTVQMGDTNLSAPAATVCPGVAFNQWKGSTHPEILLDAGSYFAWNHCFDEVFIPDTKAVYHVDLNANGGIFPSDDYQQLWYAVDMGWYKDEALRQRISNSTMPSSYLPTNQGSSFNGWFTDPISGEQRGNMISSGWGLPNSISTDEEWWAHWGQCALGEFWIGGECKSCSEATYGEYPFSDAGATSVTQCYKLCSICLNGGCPTIHGANCVYNSNDPSVQNNGKNYNNGIDTCVPNSTPAPNCPYTITDCNEPGWIPAQDGQSCVEDEKHTITLDAHIIHGVGSDPDVLYTWHNRGVYLYSNYTGEMTTGQNPINDNPLNYAIVTFNLNGQGASLVWNGQTYTGTMNANVLFDYRGFWKSVNGSPRYIDIDGHINGNGMSVGMAATDDLTWHARWQPRALGTISPSGNNLPEPTRPGYTFDGWYDLPVGGNQVYSSSLVNNDMTVYARWSDEIYTVNLVSDRNNCQPSNNTPTKLFEKYNVGWNRYTTGTFDPNLTLTDDELPTPNAGYVFDGYYDAPSGGQRVIRSDGRVIQEPDYTDNTHTWYARCVRPNGPFTVTFKCDTDGHTVQSNSVNYGANVTAPTVADANCTKPGHTFNKWKAMVNNENIVFNAGETYSWGYYSGADFVPNWVLDAPYHVTLDQNGATQPGVTDLYEKYGLWWSLYQSGNPAIPQLSGNALPRKTGSNFRGYQNESGDWMGTYNSTTGVWRLPSNTTVTSDETWTAQWDNCVDGEYWLNGICESCSKQTNGEYTHSDPGATSVTQCYKECPWYCTPNGCPGTQPAGMSSCTYGNVSGNGIQYNVPGATCQLQGQPNFPQNSCQACTDCCPMNITCDKGYDLVGCECRDNRYTITLDSNLYNDNGTLANPSTLYTWFNHGVYRDFARTLEMTPNENPLAVGTPSTFATVTLNGNGAYFNWHDQYGPQLQDNVDFVFDGFYDTTGAATDPVIGINRYITEAGQSIGKTAQNNQTWRASWRNGSVDLPGEDIMSRDGYTFDGWWTECNGGTRVSMGDQTITVSRDRTLCAHWVNKSYTVTYNCDSEGGQGGTATDSQLAYQNTTYTVRENFIPCSKPATETTRAHEFENWKFNLNSNSYWPGDSIMWIFNAYNPTFNAHYKECPNGWYFDGSCKQCPNGYTSSDIDADSATKCYDNCSVQCTESCPQLGEPGVIGCIYPTPRPTIEGQEYYGSTCNAVAGNCAVIGVYCQNGYVPTSDGLHCQKDEDNYYEITLDPNCGQGTVIPGDQEKLYTIKNIGVYLNPARTNAYQMGVNRNPLVSGDWARCIVTATFNHCDNGDENCDGATIEQKTVDLGFNGYYKAETNGTRYTDTRQEDGQLKSYITQQGIDAGKGYTANATWFAQWLDGQVGSQKWPSAPTRIGTCGVIYEFVDWYTAANGGDVVSPSTPISEDVTWYAHWCESCPTGTIDHGSCNAPNCKATFTCDDGYYWNADDCSCSATTGLTLTYQPNGGTPDMVYQENMSFGQTFTTRDGNTYTKVGHIIAKWANVGAGGNFPLLAHNYTYDHNGNTTLKPEWKQCTCTFDANSGVESCDADVVTNNTCTPDVVCKPGYINGHYSCTNEYLETCSAQCDICPAGTYQNGGQCSPCDGNTVSAAGATVCDPCASGYTANAEHTQCVGNPITIDWVENGGQLVNNGSCQFCTNTDDCGDMDITCESCGAHLDNTLTLANVTHSNSAMQFLGWKLFTGDSTYYPAGTNVMCTYDNVGVYSGTSREIKAQWNECQCNYPLNPHVAWCQAWFADGECKYMNGCDAGYEPDPLTVYTPAAVCNPKNYNITYNCGDGIGIPEYLTDSATFNENYTVKGRGTCQMTGFNFAGWKLNVSNSPIYQPGDTISPWNFTQQNPTFTAQYSQCAAGEVWVNGACKPCTCSQDNWSSGVASCTASPSSISACSAVVTCDTGYNNPQGNCNGATCSAQCDQIQSNAIYVCGDGTTGTPPATETMNYGATHTVKGQTSCAKSGYTFNGWNFTGTNGNYNPGATVQWNYETNQTFTGNWCENCVQPNHGECSLNAGVAGMCSYNCNCNAGYTLVGGVCTAQPVCERSEYNITYQPNGGMNNGVLGQPVIQDVTYGVGFTTKDGTIFTKENSIVTAWDHIDGGNYPDLNAWYQYNTIGDTVLGAHWEQCTCTLGAGAESCGTLSTAGNACNWTNPVCQNGYVSPNMQCSGTGNTNCTLTCGECAEGEIIVDGQCVPCTCTTGTGAASCTPGATANNTCTAVGQCMVGYGNENGNANVVCSDTNCVVSYNECGDGWVSNENCQCNECPANTYQSGNTCVPCQNGYTSPAGSSSADACVPGAHTIHYLSNNGMNQTYDQSVTYGQSFMTEGGTRFTYTNHIMTRWNVESGASSTFTNGTATLSGNYVYNDTADTTLSAQWEQCTCDADNCTTYATNSNTCACNATCPTGYTYGGCECDGTVCEPICTLGGSNAVYKCGTGIGTGYSTYVNYGDPHTILTNAFVGCYRDNSTFAGWAFNGDNNIYFDNVGATVTWDYTTDKEFEARWCSNCPVVEHGTNLLTIPEPGLCRCDLTCNTGYHVENGTCEPNVYPNENGITYKPNGGTPNRNYTQSVIYDAPFTTLGVVYSKARHILNRWDVESGGAGTFNGGYADLGREYIYKTDGATVLAADWNECATDEISLNNTCRQCGCATGTGAASCGTLSTDDDTCTWGPVSCQTGYVTPVLDCLNDTTNCTASCTPCGTTQVEVNGTCTDCVCNVEGDVNGIISGCVFVSNNGNTCNWNPTTCRLGYGNPNLTCDDSGYNNNCTASCTICPAGTYGDNGVECKPCPEGKTSLAGATSISECFIDPNSCAPDEHIEHGECVSNTRACSIPDATSAVRIWNPAIGTYGPCTVEVDGCKPGYHVSGNVCVKDTEACTVEHGHGERDWNGTSWGACGDVVCDPGYEPNSDYTACVECSNRRVNGDIAVSGYIYECEIAACMYQGQKYALQNGECVPICENASDETGTKVWDERTKKCIRTCNPGYKMW